MAAEDDSSSSDLTPESPPTIVLARQLLDRALLLTQEISLLRSRIVEREGGAREGLPSAVANLSHAEKKASASAEKGLPHENKGVGVFMRSVQTEIDDLTAYLADVKIPATADDAAHSADDESSSPNPDDPITPEMKLRTQLQCTNIAGMEAKWNVVKRCHGLVSMMTAFPHADTGKGKRFRRKTAAAESASSVMVDAVVDSGAEWVRICGDNERRVILQIAASGWAEDDSDDDQDVVDDDEPIFVLKIASYMVKAARRNRFRYAPPRVHIVLPRISAGHVPLIDRLLARLRRLGESDVRVVVDCANSPFLSMLSPPLPLPQALSALLRIDELGPLTDPLNIDCSILVALASDITHQRVAVEKWHHAHLAAQIERENEGPPGVTLRVMCGTALGGRALVCPFATAWHFLGIVYQLGRRQEIRRAHVLLPGEFVRAWREGNPQKARRGDGLGFVAVTDGSGPGEDLPELLDCEEVAPFNDCSARVAELQRLSIHPIPSNLKLPVSISGERLEDWTPNTVALAVDRGELPKAAVPMARELKQPNLSTFMAGWAARLTTYTSNGEMGKLLPRFFEEHRGSEAESGPAITVCRINRALASTPKPQQHAKSEQIRA